LEIAVFLRKKAFSCEINTLYLDTEIML
jgi:hypothetical protein